MKLYRGPWVWDSEVIGGSWVAPQGTIGSIDLRTLAGVGDGLFMTDANLPSPYQLLTNDRHQMASIAYDLLTTDPDHEGITAHKPLFPNGDKYEVFLGDTKIEEKLIRSGKMWDATCRVIQADVEKIHAQNPMLARKYLGFLERHHGDYSKFVPSRLAGLRSAKPETTYTDDFNRANSSSLGASWTSVGTGSGGYGIASNQCTYGGAQTDSSVRYARYDSDVSSSDHYTEATVPSAPQSGTSMGVTARHSTSNVTTCYSALLSDSNIYIYKMISNAYTVVSSSLGVGANSGTLKISCNGSTIKSYFNSVEKQSATDTSITGNLRGGLWSFGHAVNYDNWSVSDLVSASATRKMCLLGCG